MKIKARFAQRWIVSILIPVIYLCFTVLLNGCVAVTSMTPLTKAARDGDANTVMNLIETGANVNEKSSYAMGRYGWEATPLEWAIFNGKLDVVKILIDKGVNVNQRLDEYGRTPLFDAISYKKADIVKFLISRGANINVTDSVGWTPLQYAVTYHYTDIVKILLTPPDEKLSQDYVIKEASHQPVMDESFIDNRNRWFIGNIAQGNTSISNGRYIFASNDKSGYYVIRKLDLSANNDFQLDVDFKEVTVSNESVYGIWSGVNYEPPHGKRSGFLGLVDSVLPTKDTENRSGVLGLINYVLPAKDSGKMTNGYGIFIKANTDYAVYIRFESALYPLSGWTKSSFIKSSGNKLTILKQGGVTQFLINDNSVQNIISQPSYGSNFAIQVGKGTSVSISRVYAAAIRKQDNQAIAANVSLLKDDSLQTANELEQEVEQFYKQGRYAEAIPVAETIRAIREKAFGLEHPNTASSLNNLAVLYKTVGSYDKAELLNKRALAIREKHLGPEHPDTALSLNNLASLYDTMGSYDKAEPLYERSLAIAEKIQGPEHPETDTALNNLAALYKNIGAYDKAEPLYVRSLANKEKVLGLEHPDTAQSLNNLALIYDDMRAYDKAEPLYKRSLAIKEKTLGPEHPDTATTLDNLAELYRIMGAYDKAEPLYSRVLAIKEKALGPVHPDTDTSLNSLATLYKNMGSYDKAEPLYVRSLAIKEKVLGPEHPDTARSLNNLAMLYKNMGSYDKAEPLYKRSLVISEKALGPEHPDTAASLNNLAMLYMTMGSYDKAEPLFQRSLAIKEKVLGPVHPDSSLALNNLAVLYENMGIYDKAEPLYRRSLAIKEKALGPEHPDTALALGNLGELYRTMGAYDKAEPLQRRSLTIREKVLGPVHPDTALALNNLAALYFTMGSYDKAEPLYRRSVVIYEKALGRDHPGTAVALGNLAGLYSSMGAYDKAEPLQRRSLAINEKVLGPEHPDTALALGNLAELYSTIGAYDKAEPLYIRSLAIREKALGPVHPDTALALNNLAVLYFTMGSYDKAEPIYRRALAIYEKALGPEHPQTALALNNLALLYVTMGAHDKAKPLYQRAMVIKEKALGLEHPDTAGTLNNLAELYRTIGAYDQAEPLLKRALAIYEKALGPEHPTTALALNNLAALYFTMGAYDQALPIFRRALAISERTMGPEHPSTTRALNNLAWSSVVQGQNGEALALMERAQWIDRKQIEQILGFAPEAQQTQFLATLENTYFAYLSLIRQHFLDNPKAIRNALDVWLARKGILLEAQKRIQNVLAGDGNPQAQESFAKLIGIRQELARLVLGVPGKEGPEAYQKRIADLTSQKEILEGQLSRLSQIFAQRRKTRIATTSVVASTLPKGAVLIEMVRMKDLDFRNVQSGASRYLAFVLTSGKSPDVSLIDLGDADNIDQKAADFKKSLGNSKTPPDLLAKQSNDLYRLIFAPLTSALGKSRQIFLSPDGSLNLIPFEVLRNDNGRYLIETHTFRYVSAGRDIAGYGMIKEKGQKALLMGDPDFDLAAGQATEEKERTLTRSRNMQGISFSRLPGTKEEVEAIAAILGRSASNTYTGKTARESVLTQSKSPRILHMATHGFFLSDQDWSSLMDEKSRGIIITAKEAPLGKKPVRTENPFLRAGLALAGANRSLAQEGVTEGILTAEKILGLNLRGTDLVVLSACETGVGDVKNGEGVYGLRRAFTQAGAKSLVMSLWEVPDKETKELMVSFYKNLQSGKMNRAEALRSAALKQRTTVMARYGSDNPYYWAAFVFLGEAE